MLVQQFRTNLNCGRCVTKVKPQLDAEEAITRWSVDLDHPEKVLTIEGESISPETIQRRLAEAGFQVLGPAAEGPEHDPPVSEADDKKPLLVTYRPLLLVFAYLVGLVALGELVAGNFDGMRAMGNFMGGFFIAFSFFKLLDLRGFVDSFQTYDVLARRVRAYGFLYPFLELGLGIAYLLKLAPLATNITTLLIMGIGIIGVTQALLNKRQIKCACLGTVFNLPMSRVTFVEDALMGAMALVMIAQIAVTATAT